MAPTVALEVQQLTFHELLSHLVSAHEREVFELRAEVKQLRNAEGCSSSGSASVLEMSSFPSRQPTLAGFDMDYAPLPEDTEAIITEATGELTISRPTCGPDAEALASALQVACEIGMNFSVEDGPLQDGPSEALVPDFSVEVLRTLGLGVIPEDRVPSRVSDDELRSLATPSSQAQEVFHSPLSNSAEIPSALRLPQVTPFPSFLPASPLDDHEPVPEEDKSGMVGAAPEAQVRSASRSSKETKDSITFPSREWSLPTERTGDAPCALSVHLSDGTVGLDAGLGLSSAIWVEITDSGRDGHEAVSPTSLGSPSRSDVHESRRDSAISGRKEAVKEDGIKEDKWIDGNQAVPSSSRKDPRSTSAV